MLALNVIGDGNITVTVWRHQVSGKRHSRLDCKAMRHLIREQPEETMTFGNYPEVVTWLGFMAGEDDACPYCFPPGDYFTPEP